MNHKVVTDKDEYTYNDFWEMRGRQSIWVTRNVSYRVGAWIAYYAYKLGLSPNTISLLSGLITVLSAMLAIWIGQGSWVAGVVLVLGLQIGYAFDCADGPLARATGGGSSFGMLMDKLVDLSSGMIFPCVLAYGAGHYYCPYYDNRPDYTLRILLLVLIIRVFLNVLLWLKELMIYEADRLKEDPREHNLWWKIKKAVSIYIDEPVYRFLIAVAWSLGYFWEFSMVYSLGIFLIILVYVASTKREMDAMDRKASRIDHSTY